VQAGEQLLFRGLFAKAKLSIVADLGVDWALERAGCSRYAIGEWVNE
jgi:hypothetical protein